MPKPLTFYPLDEAHRRKARRLAAGILRYTRAYKRGTPVPEALERALARVQPIVYLWHFFAWKMRGFTRDAQLGTTDAREVVVVRGDDILIGDPMTEVITRIDLTEGHVPVEAAEAKGIAAGLKDVVEGRVRPLSEIDAELATTPRPNVPVVDPRSKFRYH